VQNAAALVAQNDGAAQTVQGLGHPRALDRARVEHVADGHRSPDVR
jgi:hypothetical protein